MTIPSSVRKAGPYSGNGATTSFPFSFKVFKKEDVKVTRTSSLGVESVLTVDIDYSVALNPDQSQSPGGSITYPISGSPLPSDELITLSGSLAYDQPTDIQNQGGFYPDVIEDALDRATIQIQQLAERADRAVQVPVSSSTSPEQLITSLIQGSADAVQAASNAQQSELNASTSESNARQSELNAAQSELNAAQSEFNAGASEQNAGQSETKAKDWATKPEDSPVEPGLYSSFHWAQKSSNSASAANQSESNASTSESNAKASELAAAQSENNASASESNASTSESNAAQSESNAKASELASQAFLESLVAPFQLAKLDETAPCLLKTDAEEIAVKAGTVVFVGGTAIPFTVDTTVDFNPTFATDKGTDWSVWIKPNGDAVAVLDMYSSPAVAPELGAVKIGGFHYGLVGPAETVASGSFSTSGVTNAGGSMAWTQADVDRLAGINEFSIWDLAFHAKGEQRGMVFEPLMQVWHGIYFTSTDIDANGLSAYNTNVCSGTVLPKVPLAWGGNGILTYAAFRSWEANELATALGCRLVRYEEFVAAAFGVTEGQSLGGASATIPATLRQPGYTSRIGLEQATGHVWVTGGPINSSNGSAYAGNGRGSWYGTSGKVLLGGLRDGTSHSGSRAANFGNALSSSLWDICLRVASDHVNLGRTAR